MIVLLVTNINVFYASLAIIIMENHIGVGDPLRAINPVIYQVRI